MTQIQLKYKSQSRALRGSEGQVSFQTSFSFFIFIYCYLHTCILSVSSAFIATGFLFYTYISEMVLLDIKKYFLLCICTFRSQEDAWYTLMHEHHEPCTLAQTHWLSCGLSHTTQAAPELEPSMASWAVAFGFFISTAVQHIMYICIYGECVMFDWRKY